jgi:hypothetical protein
MSDCVKIETRKYSFRNSPPYSANKCKSIKKRGNDGNLYVSQPDKNGTYKWVNVNKNKTLKHKSTKNKTLKNKATSEDLQMLVKKYEVTKSGSNREIAERLVNLRGPFIKNKTDRKIIEQFLKKSTPSTKRWGFVPAKA